MRAIAHISDLHFGRTDPVLVEALVADLRATAPDLIIVSGDLTQDAARSEFATAREFLRSLPARFFVIPGNHDMPRHNLWARITRPMSRYRRFIAHDLSPLLVDDELAVVGINTARRFLLSHWNWSYGSISRNQIEHARRQFAGLPAKLFKIVVTHHPFLPPPDSPETRLVGRARSALRIFEACGVDLLLAGHLHKGFTGDVSTHHAAIRRSILVAQASTATSTRVRDEPNAYNRILLDGPALTLQARTWDGRAFVATRERLFEKIDDAWIAKAA